MSKIDKHTHKFTIKYIDDFIPDHNKRPRGSGEYNKGKRYIKSYNCACGYEYADDIVREKVSK